MRAAKIYESHEFLRETWPRTWQTQVVKTCKGKPSGSKLESTTILDSVHRLNDKSSESRLFVLSSQHLVRLRWDFGIVWGSRHYFQTREKEGLHVVAKRLREGNHQYFTVFYIKTGTRKQLSLKSRQVVTLLSIYIEPLLWTHCTMPGIISVLKWRGSNCGSG